MHTYTANVELSGDSESLLSYNSVYRLEYIHVVITNYFQHECVYLIPSTTLIKYMY